MNSTYKIVLFKQTPFEKTHQLMVKCNFCLFTRTVPLTEKNKQRFAALKECPSCKAKI